jgi:hypothetical protein
MRDRELQWETHIGLVRDITAWRALADCEARFGATFENAGVGIHTDSG